ncbi:YfiT family bacillithiol transferase [Staphylococcus carnosus]|nr:putative metal-dependent hydrolase [Staphylococcus carnosus]
MNRGDNMLKNQFPIGKYVQPETFNRADIEGWIHAIEKLPEELTTLTSNLSQTARHATYREGSWDVQTLVHHIADAHMHGFIRTKLILTENQPNVCSFEENEWVKLPDNEVPLEYSLDLINGIHKRWATLLSSLPVEAYNRTMYHADGGVQKLADLISKMAWHGDHHLEHIRIALNEVEA